METTPTLNKWNKIIEEQESSGLTQKDFCEQKKIQFDTFKYHRAKYRSPKKLKSINSFVEVPGTMNSGVLLNNLKQHSILRLNFEIKDWLKFELQLG